MVPRDPYNHITLVTLKYRNPIMKRRFIATAPLSTQPGDNMPNKHRHGKLVDGGHSTTLRGLKEFLKRFNTWDEVDLIVLGRVANRKVGGGDLSFRATRWALAGGSQPSGILCTAARGPMVQTVILTSHNPEALRQRLQAAGYANW